MMKSNYSKAAYSGGKKRKAKKPFMKVVQAPDSKIQSSMGPVAAAEKRKMGSAVKPYAKPYFSASMGSSVKPYYKPYHKPYTNPVR
jgi:hypothetical protein